MISLRVLAQASHSLLRPGATALGCKLAARPHSRRLAWAATSAWQQQHRPVQQQAASASAARCRAGLQPVCTLAPSGGRRLAAAAQAAKANAATAAAEDDEEFEADVVGELGDADGDFLEDLEDTEEDVGAEISTGGVEWGEKALAVVQQLLSSPDNGLADIQLFSFRAIPSSKRLDIRLDKTTDPFGSPSLDDVAAFSRLFNAAYEAAIGEAAAGDVEVEVSSPGAERQVRVPGELQRFAELPMKVEYALQDDKVETKVLSYVEHDSAVGLTRWRLADVRVNRTGGKGRGLNKKQRETIIEIAIASLRRVNLHIDF